MKTTLSYISTPSAWIFNNVFMCTLGYIRYMNVRREELKKVKPESTAIEVIIIHEY